jgi:hypothetical protein
MATLILTAVGTAVGGPLGGAVGAILGQAADGALFAPKPRQGPRLGELAVQTSSYGTPIPKIFGIMRVAGTVIWSTDLIERRTTTGGGKGRAGTVNYSYSASFAVGLSARPVIEVRRVWADGKLLRGAAGDFKVKTGFRFHTGDKDQAPDPAIVAAEGVGQAPAFRGIAYAMFEDLELADYGNRIPSLTFELVAEAAPVPAAEIAAELGGPAVVAGASQALIGFAATGDSVRGAVADLSALLPLHYRDDGVVLTVGESDGDILLLAAAHEVGRREIVRRAAGSVPGEVTLTYYDAARDYQTSLQRADRGAPSAPSERRAVPAVLDAAGAKAMAERRLDAALAERISATAKFSWAMAAVRPGALVTLPDASGAWRVARWTLGSQQVTLELRRDAPASAPPVAATAGRPLAEPDQPQGATALRLLDIPFDNGVVALAGGASPGWRRATLSASFDDGASWADIGRTAAPAILGSAASVLSVADSTLLDGANSVNVVLLHDDMELLSVGDDALMAGANLALVGDELIQFGSAVRTAPCAWRLSRLLRGRRGTEWAAATHISGEPFALIEAASSIAVPLPAGIGAGASIRLLASGPGDDHPAAAALTLRLEGQRPPSPVHFTAVADTTGDIRLAWVRRSRAGWDWAGGGDAPLGEDREAYRLSFTAGGITREVDTDAPDFLYTAAERVADGAGPVDVAVRQIGDRALSRAATLTIA